MLLNSESESSSKNETSLSTLYRGNKIECYKYVNLHFYCVYNFELLLYGNTLVVVNMSRLYIAQRRALYFILLTSELKNYLQALLLLVIRDYFNNVNGSYWK